MSGARSGFNLLAYRLPIAGNRLDFNLGVSSETTTPDPRLNLNLWSAWTAADRVDGQTQLNAWELAELAASLVLLPWSGMSVSSAATLSAWSPSVEVDATVSLVFEGSERLASDSVSVVWKDLEVVSNYTKFNYGGETQRGAVGLLSSWNLPPVKVVVQMYAWEYLERVSSEPFELPWTSPGLKSFNTKIPWEFADRLPWLILPEPPVVVVPPISTVKRGDRVGFNLRCTVWSYPGNRVPLYLGDYRCATNRPYGVVVVINEVYIKRVPDNLAIAATSISISTSVDDFCWVFEGSVSSAAQPYLEATEDGPIEIEVGINGYVWRFIVENADETELRTNKSLNKTLSVRGRSKTALLSSDYAPKVSRVNTTVRTSQQFINDSLAYLDTEIDYGTTSWVIPANAVSVEGAPIDVARAVANAVGGVIYSSQADLQLYLRPRFPISPWLWLTSSIDKSILSSWVVQSSSQVANQPLYNAVIVQGQQQGVQVNAKIVGSAGDLYLPQFVDQFILTVPVAREKARNLLSNRGKQTGYTLKLPLFRADVNCGMVTPLLLCQFVDGARSWLAQSVAIRISASVDGKAIQVWQDVLLERHLNDAN